jgi:transcription initiation factor TFIIH subunit 1
MATPKNSPILTAEVSVKKQLGKLRVWAHSLRWTEAGKTEDLIVDFSDIKSQAVNASSDKAMLRITREDSSVVTINFSDLQARDTVKEVIATAMAQKLAAGITPGRASPSGKPQFAKSSLREKDIAIRTQLLTKDKTLANLHREFVVSGKITEEEFWEPRGHLLRDLLLSDDQKRGKTSVLLTDTRVEPGMTESGSRTAKITLTSELIHQIFVQYPHIHKAYQDNVPDKISEKEFWTRYFTHRNRQSLTLGTKDQSDDIFDSIQTNSDEPLRKRLRQAVANDANAEFDTFLNLEATEGDSGKTWGGNKPDMTMVPGRDKTDVSLIRRLNRHSTSVLEDSIKAKHAFRTTNDELILDDLQGEKPVHTVPLNIGDERVYFTSQVFGLTENVQQASVSTMDDAKLFLESLHSLSVLSSFHSNAQASLHATQALEELQARADKSQPTLTIHLDIASLQASTQEALRHFWSAYPPDTQQKQGKLTRVVATLKDKMSQFHQLQAKPPVSLTTESVKTVRLLDP